MLAFRSARSRGINVSEALEASLCYVGHTQGKLGIEATCRFLQSIGVGFDPGAMLERPHTDKSCHPWSDCSSPEELTSVYAGTKKGEVLANGIPHIWQASSRPKDGSLPNQAGTPRCQSCHAPEHLIESVSRAKPSRATQEQCQADGGAQQDEGNCVSYATAKAPDPLENEAVETRTFIDEASPNRRQEYAGDDGSNSTPKIVTPMGGDVYFECRHRSVGNSSRFVGSAAPFYNEPRGNR